MSVGVYAGVPAASAMRIGAYVGIPLQRSGGELFGTLCAADPMVHTETLREHEPLLTLLSGLLTAVLEADLARAEASRATESALRVADTDGLTGLLNRRGWDRHLDLEEQRCQRFGDPASVIMLDLDGLKAINDSQGHTAGDEHLQLAATVLAATVRGSDMAARLGGDEFAVPAARTTTPQAQVLAARLQRALHAAGIAASLGHAAYTRADGLTGEAVAADAMMHADKARRRPVRSRP